MGEAEKMEVPMTVDNAEPLPIPGKEPVFRHVDETMRQKVRRQRNADGTEGTIFETWFAFSEDPQYLSLLAVFSPGMIVRRHGHLSPHVIYIIEGGAWYQDRWCPKGTHIELPFGAAFGPIVAGPEGATMFEVMMGDPRSWGDGPELIQQVLEEHGVQVLPDPPIALPEWLEDFRDHWSDSGDGH
jgi:hypothetical protein